MKVGDLVYHILTSDGDGPGLITRVFSDCEVEVLWNEDLGCCYHDVSDLIGLDET